MINDTDAQIIIQRAELTHGAELSIYDIVKIAHESGIRVVLNEINKKLDQMMPLVQAS